MMQGKIGDWLNNLRAWGQGVGKEASDFQKKKREREKKLLYILYYILIGLIINFRN